jgi:subtilase family serine protease
MTLSGRYATRVLANSLVIVLAIGLTNPAYSENGKVVVRGNTPAALQKAVLVGHSDPNRVLDIVVGLNLHNEQELRDLIVRQTDPASPDYHHFLTPAEFNERFAPTSAGAESVSRYLEWQGLAVLQVTSNRLLVHARGTVAQVEKAFDVTINDYTLKGERHFSNDRDPSVPIEVSGTIKSVAGLTSFGRFHSMARSVASTSATPLATYTPSQVATAYNFPQLEQCHPREANL